MNTLKKQEIWRKPARVAKLTLVPDSKTPYNGQNVIKNGEWLAMLKRILKLILKKRYRRLCDYVFYFHGPKLDNLISDIEIDAVFVTIDKDIDTLKLSIESVRKFVKHPIRRFVLITRDDMFFKQFCKENGCEFIDETSIIGFDKTALPPMNGREGWLYQQLLKLGYADFSKSEHYLVMDSDTVFVKNRVFIHDSKTYFDYSDEYHKPYRNAYNKLFGFDYDTKKSFVCHHMLFAKTKVKEMMLFIENRHKCKWGKAIIDCADYTSPSCFSEYETYGNFFLHFYGNEMMRSYWYNISVNSISALRKQYPKWIRSVSCHSYSRLHQPILSTNLTQLWIKSSDTGM
jgi:hypothetical protein